VKKKLKNDENQLNSVKSAISLSGIKTPGRLLSIDYGKQRIGVAMSDPMQMLASSLCTIHNTGAQKSVNELVEICKKNEIITIVVGMPINMNGSYGDSAQAARDFANALQQKITIPVLHWDERWTTVSAQKSLISQGKSPSQNRDRIDQIAAAFLLQAFLDRLAFVRKHGEQ